ncbi:MAG: elongation factor G-like protein, partial [Frankiales bacterium]|nr:elongation factor G-like protein [Frankiales bacterium]
MDNPDLLPRTVVLLGAPGAGKSELLDALLAAGGGAPASGAPTELRHGTVQRAGRRVHLLDPPGEPQLPGPLAAGLRAAGAAVLVLSPLQGLDPRTVALWHACEEAELPLVIAVSQLDRPGADADEATALAQRLLGDAVLPLQLPLHDDDGLVAGVLDLLTLRVVDHSTGTERAADPEHVTLVENLREELLEAALAGGDEEAFDLWVAGGDPGEVDLAAAVARGDLQPLLVTSPRHGVGLEQLLDLLAALPPAAERLPPAATDAAGDPVHLAGEVTGPLVAEVVRAGTAADLARIWSGRLDGALPGDVVAVAPGHRAGDVLG